ncbi:hypothetical protein [Opitutus terrae]|uniref:hypothetical protein n=1 Tax=Opitutus terrae TaxID=107709 RepID=UPI0011D0B97D|nr:hypothetical protein [Opitutus terrae]
MIGLAFFVSQLAEIPYRSALRGYDNTFNYLWLRSAIEDGDWDFRNDLAACNTLVPEQRAAALGLPPTKSDRIPNKYGVGWAVLTLPSYLAAESIVGVGRWTGWWSLSGDGFGPVHQIAVQVGHALLAVLALLLAVKVISSWLNDRAAALLGLLTVWLASPLLYYQSVNLSMSHGAAFFAIALLAYALERATAGSSVDRPTVNRGWWLLAGAAFGLAVTTRFQLVVFGVVVAWTVRRAARCRAGSPDPAAPRAATDSGDLTLEIGSAAGAAASGDPALRLRAVSSLAMLVLGAAPFVLLQLWAWRVVYGEWFVFSYGAEGEAFHWARPELLNSWFSSWHGLFYWHPFLLVAFTGMLGWIWQQRGAALGWGAAWCATAFINAAWWCWWFASAFGNRGYDAALLPMMAGAGWLFRRAGARSRRALLVIAAAAAGWNVYLALLYRSGAIARHAPVTWLEMLAAAKQLPDALRF